MTKPEVPARSAGVPKENSPQPYFEHTPDGLRYFSAFSGIGAAELAFYLSGWAMTCVGWCENDIHAAAMYRYRMPDHPYYLDMTKLDYGKIPNFDLLVGGFPCQDLSKAGKRRGLKKGTRSGDGLRALLALFAAKKPRHFMFENVVGMDKDIREAITRALGVEPVAIDAAKCCAQHRERLFWCSWPVPKWIDMDDIPMTLGEGRRGGGADSVIADILDRPIETDPAKRSRELVQIRPGSQGYRLYDIHGKGCCLCGSSGGKGAKTGLYLIDGEERALTPTEAEKLQCVPDEWTKWGTYPDPENPGKLIIELVPRTQRLKMLGNAFNVEVARRLIHFIALDEIAHGYREVLGSGTDKMKREKYIDPLEGRRPVLAKPKK